MNSGDRFRAVARDGLGSVRRHDLTNDDLKAVADLLEAQAREIEGLKQDVIAFCGPWGTTYAREFGLPKDHLHPTHYDILERCGARMVDFTRAALQDGRMG